MGFYDTEAEHGELYPDHEFDSVEDAAYYTGLPHLILEKAICSARVEPFLLASICGAELSTVSPKYAKELLDKNNDCLTGGLSSEFSKRKIKINGIINGL